MERERGAAALWGHGHLPLLARARSKDSVEYILQALWRTRRTGLDAADRAVTRDILQLSDDADLDPVRGSPPPPPCHSPPLCDAVQLD
jgi:COMM domain containing 9